MSLPFPTTPEPTYRQRQRGSQPDESAGQVAGNTQASSVAATGTLSASWSSSSVTGFQAALSWSRQRHGGERPGSRDWLGERRPHLDQHRCAGHQRHRCLCRQRHGQPLVLRPRRVFPRRQRRLGQLHRDRHGQRLDHAHDHWPDAQRPAAPRRELHDHDQLRNADRQRCDLVAELRGLGFHQRHRRHDQPRPRKRHPLRRRQAAQPRGRNDSGRLQRNRFRLGQWRRHRLGQSQRQRGQRAPGHSESLDRSPPTRTHPSRSPLPSRPASPTPTPSRQTPPRAGPSRSTPTATSPRPPRRDSRAGPIRSRSSRSRRPTPTSKRRLRSM